MEEEAVREEVESVMQQVNAIEIPPSQPRERRRMTAAIRPPESDSTVSNSTLYSRANQVYPIVTVTTFRGCTSHHSRAATPMRKINNPRRRDTAARADEFAKASIAPRHGQQHAAGKRVGAARHQKSGEKRMRRPILEEHKAQKGGQKNGGDQRNDEAASGEEANQDGGHEVKLFFHGE